MTLAKLNDVRIFADDYDLASAVNDVALNGTRDAKDATTFGDGGWATSLAGLKTVDLDVKGFYEVTTSDAAANDLDSGGAALFSFCHDDAAASIAYFGRAVVLSARRGFQIGEVAKLDIMAKHSAREGIVRGTLLFPKTTATATGTGSSNNLGAVSATQTLYAGLHVFSASAGDTLDVKVQSDNATGFPSATDRITFTQFSGAVTGSELRSLAGAITDDWWRVSYTIAGNGSESFSFAVVLGIA